MADLKLTDITADLKHETEKAFLINNDRGEDVWLPKQFVENNSDGTFTMPEWLAIDKGLV